MSSKCRRASFHEEFVQMYSKKKEFIQQFCHKFGMFEKQPVFKIKDILPPNLSFRYQPKKLFLFPKKHESQFLEFKKDGTFWEGSNNYNNFSFYNNSRQ